MEEVKPPKSASAAQVLEKRSHQVGITKPRWGYEEYVFAVAYVIGMSIWYLPTEKIDGNPVPTIVFKGQPMTFHSFLLGLVGAFTCAVCTMYIREPNPKLAGYFRRSAVVFLASSFFIALWASGPAHWIHMCSPFVN